MSLDAWSARRQSLPARRRDDNIRRTRPVEPGPAGSDAELPVESGGMFQGRFLMTPVPDARPTLEQRLLAVALADQAGAALATSHPVDQS
ncbi:MAG: hypothetical protein ACRDRL_04075 [Sciscionella sp.]